MSEKILTKLTSGRFLLVVASAVVFAIMSIKGMLAGEFVAGLLTMVMRDYFSRNDREKLP
jgi:hypothetical protein